MWGDTGGAILFLLRAWERAPAAFGDDTGIPESGNGVADVLDEVKWELDWLLKMQRPDGSVLSRMHVAGFASDSPPSADTNPRLLREPERASPTRSSSAAAALGSRVYAAAGPRGVRGTPARGRAPHLGTACSRSLRSELKVWAAAELFRMDPTVASARPVVDLYHPNSWAGVFLNVMSFDTQAALAYVETPGATAPVAANMRADISAQVDYIFGEDDLYRNGMPDWSYHWGSNSIRAGYGVFLLEAARLGQTGGHTAAEPARTRSTSCASSTARTRCAWCTSPTCTRWGASTRSWQLYHAWFGDSWSAHSRANHIGKPSALAEPGYPYFAGVDNHGVPDNKTSAPRPRAGDPGRRAEQGLRRQASPPLGAAGTTASTATGASSGRGRAPNTWEITENSIKYQGPYVSLASAFYRPGGADRAAPRSGRAAAGSDGNQVFEPGETVTLAPAWRNHRFVPSAITGAASSFSGPAGPSYAIADAAASYGTLAAGASGDCLATGDCYRLTVAGARPAPHWDAAVTETLGSGEARSWTCTSATASPTCRGRAASIASSRRCSTAASPAAARPPRIARPPAPPATRWRCSCWWRRRAAAYAPPACTTPMFSDVPASSPFCRWIEELARRGVVSGCGGGAFCPGAAVSREQLSIFALATREGPGWAPPACATPHRSRTSPSAARSAAGSPSSPGAESCPAAGAGTTARRRR